MRPDDEDFIDLPVGAPTRTPPASQEAEMHVLAVCILDGIEANNTITRCVVAGVTTEFFYWPANKLIYSILLKLHERGIAITLEVVVEELITRRQLEAVGGMGYLMDVTSKIPTTAHAGYFIEKIKEKYFLREMITLAVGAVEQAYQFTGGLDEYTKKIEDGLAKVIKQAEVIETPIKPLADFKLPAEDDDSTLLGENRYISRGDSAIIVSSSGMGKSSISLQMAALFALGRPAFGVPCKVTAGRDGLRSLIVQAEDSEGDIAEVWISIIHKLDLTLEQIAVVRSRVLVVRDKIHRGQAFVHNTQLLAERHEADLVWINPLQNYVEGDITDKKVIGDFLYDGLNRANRHDKWAWMIIHHTTKPPTGQNAKTQRNWNEVMYEMAGASTLIDWARAIMILKATKTEGEFNLHLAKRGARAGVVKKLGLSYVPSTVIPLKHATGEITIEGRKRNLPIIFWETREIPEAEEKPEPKREKKEGLHANALYPDDEIVSYFPPSTELAHGFTGLAKDAKVGCGIGTSAFAARVKRLLSNGLIDQSELGQYRRTEKGDAAAKAYLEKKP